MPFIQLPTTSSEDPEPIASCISEIGEIQLASRGISSQVSSAQKQKIWKGEYVNLAHLILPEVSSGKILSVDGSGQINVTPKPTKRIVNIDN